MSLLRVFVLRQEGHLRNMLGFIGANWKALADQGRPLQVQVSEYKTKRSLEQNSLYWARLEQIADNVWVDGKQFSKDAWHGHMGDLYLPKEQTPGGRLIPISTRHLDVGEFSEYLNKIEAYAATELGVELAA